MGASYNRLFKLLIDKKMRKGELCKAANVSTTSLLKLAKGDNVQVEVLVRICRTLKCDFADIMEMEPDESENTKGEGGTDK